MVDDSRVPERLFRDDAGAAGERAARLEEDNRRLRSEVERLRRSPPRIESTSHGGPHGVGLTAQAFVVGVATATTCLGLALVFLAEPATRHRHRIHPTQHRQSLSIGAAPRARASVERPSVAPVRTADENCKSPFWIDDRGRKHYKIACLEQ